MQIAELTSKLESGESQKKIAVAEVTSEKNIEIANLKAKLDAYEKDKELALSRIENEKDKELAEKDKYILKLSGQIETSEKENQSVF